MFVEGGCIHVWLDAKAIIKQKEILNLQAVKSFIQLVSFRRGVTLCTLSNNPGFLVQI